MMIRSLMQLSFVLALLVFVVGVATMLGIPRTPYRITPGGFLNGTQTLLLFVVALYCLRRAEMW